MYGLFQNRLERDKEYWYRQRHQKPPHLARQKPKPKKKYGDTQTYTDTYVLKCFDVQEDEPRDKLTLWETNDGGPEPIDFTKTRKDLRRSRVYPNDDPPPRPKTGRINDCFTPYENDQMSFDMYETTLKELRRANQNLAQEMQRVYDEWNRPPKENWFCLKDSQFSIEFSRFNELERRKLAQTK